MENYKKSEFPYPGDAANNNVFIQSEPSIIDEPLLVKDEWMIDYAIRSILKEWKKEAGITTTVKFSRRSNVITIYTDRPGLMVGRAGTLCTKYKEIFKEKGFKEVIEFAEVSKFDV